MPEEARSGIPDVNPSPMQDAGMAVLKQAKRKRLDVPAEFSGSHQLAWRVLPATALMVTAILLSPPEGMAQRGNETHFNYTFESDAQGWTVGFADLPVGYDQSSFELAYGHRPLPGELQGSGIYVQGHNRSDDLFMFLKRQVDGLRPRATYAVSVSVDLATNVPPGLFGIGGSPGESVFVKVGASTIEPVAVKDGNRYLRMNIDKGNQSNGGQDMVVLGNVAHREVVEREYRIKTLDNLNLHLCAEADGEGRLWFIVGTDSGFEGRSAFYYSRISYTLSVGEHPCTREDTPVNLCVSEGAVSDAGNIGLVSDCEALLSARDTLAGNSVLNWAANTPVAQWEGVTIRGTPQRVTGLDLREMGLDGTISGELGLLSNLTILNLRTNWLSGPIPAELGNLISLERMLLHDNKLTGGIPDLSNLSNLKMLWLSGKEMALTGSVPSWLNTMSSLESVSLWGNELSGPIPRLTGMTSLKLLKLQSNRLSGGVPAWLGDMSSNLSSLYLHSNPLGGTIPPELGRLTSLRRLWLHSTGLTGPIPLEFGEMKGLWGLNLRDNSLTGAVPSELGNLANMRKLRLHNNHLSGGIPTELGDLSNLTDLWLSGNRLRGSIPSELGGLDNLKQLSLKNNQLSGTISARLGDLGATLTHLFLGGNSGLRGCVPEGLAAVENTDIGGLGLKTCETAAVTPAQGYTPDELLREGEVQLPQNIGKYGISDTEHKLASIRDMVTPQTTADKKVQSSRADFAVGGLYRELDAIALCNRGSSRS